MQCLSSQCVAVLKQVRVVTGEHMEAAKEQVLTEAGEQVETVEGGIRR